MINLRPSTKEYAPKYESTLTNEELEKMYDLHALWKGWYEQTI